MFAGLPVALLSAMVVHMHAHLGSRQQLNGPRGRTYGEPAFEVRIAPGQPLPFLLPFLRAPLPGFRCLARRPLYFPSFAAAAVAPVLVARLSRAPPPMGVPSSLCLSRCLTSAVARPPSGPGDRGERGQWCAPGLARPSGRPAASCYVCGEGCGRPPATTVAGRKRDVCVSGQSTVVCTPRPRPDAVAAIGCLVLLLLAVGWPALVAQGAPAQAGRLLIC